MTATTVGASGPTEEDAQLSAKAMCTFYFGPDPNGIRLVLVIGSVGGVFEERFQSGFSSIFSPGEAA